MKTVLIIEDEEATANYMQALLKEIDPDLTVLAKLTSVKSSIEWLKNNKVDLIFLDIELSDGISFEIFDEIKILTPIVITTAYNQFAIKAFNLNSLAYLLKPVTKTDLQKCIKKAESIKSFYSVDIEKIINIINDTNPSYKNRFLIHIADKLLKISVDEISFFFVEDRWVYLKTFNGEKYPVDVSLSNIERSLDPKKFFRINRKFIINYTSIQSMKSWSRSRIKVKVDGFNGDENDTVVSVYNVSSFKKWLDS